MCHIFNPELAGSVKKLGFFFEAGQMGSFWAKPKTSIIVVVVGLETNEHTFTSRTGGE